MSITINPNLGLTGDGFLANPTLCGTQVWNYYTQAYGDMLHVGADVPCGSNAYYRSYFSFNLFGLSGKTIGYAKFRFYYAGKTSPAYNVALQEITPFGTLAYSDWGSTSTYITSFGTVLTTGTATGQWIEVDVTTALQAAIDRSASRFDLRMHYGGEGVAPGTSRWYAITATDDGGNKPQLVVEAAPNTPTNLVATESAGPQVDLTWTDNSSGVHQDTSTKIERSTDGGSYAEIHSTGADAESWSDTTVSAGHSYVYRVRAYNSSGYSGYSSTAQVVLVVAPNAPTALAVTDVATAGDQVDLSWTDNSSGVYQETSIKIERQTDGGGYSQIDSIAAGRTTYSDTTTTVGHTYDYKVRYYNSAGYSGYSNVAQALTKAVPATPSNLAIVMSSALKVDISWTDNSWGIYQETSVKVERSADSGAYAEIASLAANTSTYSDTAVAINHTYDYRVRQHNAQGYSSYSNVASVDLTGDMPASTVGRSIPLCIGYCYNVSPVCIDKNNHIYQFSDPDCGSVYAIDTVYIGGVEQTTGFTTNTTLCYATFTTTPLGMLTGDVRGQVASGSFLYRVAEIASYILTSLCGISSTSISTADFTAHLSEVPYPVGLYITNKTTIRTALDGLLTGTLSYLGPNRDGIWKLRSMTAASGTPDHTFSQEDIVSIEPKNFDKIFWRVRIAGNRNWTVNPMPDGTVTGGYRSWLLSEYRQGTHEDSAILADYGTASESGPHQTYLASSDDCSILAQTWLSLYGEERRLYTITTKAQGIPVEIGDVVQVTCSQLGMSAGVLGRVVEINESYGEQISVAITIMV